MKDNFSTLTLVTNKRDQPLNEYLHFITQCAGSGVTSIQLREKNLFYKDLFEFGKKLQHILEPFEIPLIVNDNLQLAYELNADGVHLGQSDGNVIDARALLGPDKIIGITIDSIEQIHTANKLPIDYVGVGAIFESTNKKDVATILGCAGLKQIAQLSKHKIIAIGGINESNAAGVMQSGVLGIAAIAAFHDSKDPATTTKKLCTIIEDAYANQRN